ncbi:MAG: FKBP-type peptidyl-prolyl cis-trans isomerase [Alistipes sp.]|nr:FKBP-type peptidyl-prolyl cis-trans isomerase [Alistipes sp.]
MNVFRKIACFVAVVLVAMVALSCSNENDAVLTSQQTSISRYLTSSHQPRLIPEAEIPNSLDNEPQFYTQWGLDIYRYIATYYDEGRDEKSVVEHDSVVSMTYSAYIFGGSKPTISNLNATNDAENIATLEAAGLNTSYEWTDEPMVVTFGREEIIPALETALVGCVEGDRVEVYLTYDVAYGKHYVGFVPPKSAVVWIIDINSVTK